MKYPDRCKDTQMEITADTIGEHINGKIFHLSSLPQKRLTADNLTSLLESARVDVSEDIKESPTCISFLQKGAEYPAGTLDNFSAIIGKTKSRKSFFISMLIAAAVKGVLFGLIKVSFLPGKNCILYFDTEQSRYHVQRAVKRICSLSETTLPSNLFTFGLRKFTPQERLQLIEYAIYNSEGVGLVVIDGIRDLVTSINDEEQATDITSKLLKWTEERNIHIIIVLHQNKGDNNARGHIGAEIVNKAETVISITKEEDNKDVSVVKAEYCRDKDFAPFAFTIDENGLPIPTTDYRSKMEGERKTFTHADVADETHQKVLIELFAYNQAPTYKDLVSQLRVYFNKRSIAIGDNKAKDFITYYQNQAWIIKNEQAKRYPYYQLATGLV